MVKKKNEVNKIHITIFLIHIENFLKYKMNSPIQFVILAGNTFSRSLSITALGVTLRVTVCVYDSVDRSSLAV